jgi:hypothetical protein
MAWEDKRKAVIYNEINLYILEDKFVFEANGTSNKLVIMRGPAALWSNYFNPTKISSSQSSNNIANLNNTPQNITNKLINQTNDKVDVTASIKKIPIGGILGIINLQAGPYLIVIKNKEYMGSILGSQIFKLTKVKIIPFIDNNSLSDRQKKDENTYLSILENLLNDKYFYFSYTHNLLMNSEQASHYKLFVGQINTKIYENTQARYFFWNKPIASPLLKLDV